ncbi:MAG TPA: hypothetical protein VKH82_02565 [Candidatus Binatia bacterium]|nr:hypothetical protein [Candidatus Binatia bacterium]
MDWVTHRPLLRVATPGVLSLALLLGAPAAFAGPRCATPCKEETARCRQTRCGGLDGRARRDCLETCRGIGGCASIRTLSYVVTECDTGGKAVRQALRVRRGNCAPVTVMDFVASVPTDQRTLVAELCREFGAFRVGTASRRVGLFQRLSVTPDGSGVVFEVTDGVAPPGYRLFDLPDGVERGFYFVRADGQDLRRLGRASDAELRNLPYQQSDISPDGKRIVYTDLGPGPAGEAAIQVVMLDLATAQRRQLTRLPALPQDPERPTTEAPRFVDNDTVLFDSLADPVGSNPEGRSHFFTIETDGTGLRSVGPRVRPGGRVDPVFMIAGGGTNLFNVVFYGPDGLPAFQEVFLLDGKRLLQLTGLRNPETARRLVSVDGRRAFFVSADAVGRCQLFSINTLGNHLRQLTRFTVGEPRPLSCLGASAPPGCSIRETFQDPVTRTVVFGYTCDPFGGSTNGGQVFAMRPDGKGLRQLTATRGSVEADGQLTVELPGPFSYSGRWN